MVLVVCYKIHVRVNAKAIAAVIERDEWCVMCGNPEYELHHVCPRSRFGKNNRAECWQVKNMVLLCPFHHRLEKHGAGAHTHAAGVFLLTMLRDKFGYSYDEAPWSEYVEEATDG